MSWANTTGLSFLVYVLSKTFRSNACHFFKWIKWNLAVPRRNLIHVYSHLKTMSDNPGNERFSVKKLQAKRFLQIPSPLGPTYHKKTSKITTATNMFFVCFIPFGPHFFMFFLPKWCSANTKITKIHYFINRSVRRHLNEYKTYFSVDNSWTPEIHHPKTPNLHRSLEIM